MNETDLRNKRGRRGFLDTLAVDTAGLERYYLQPPTLEIHFVPL